MIRTLEVKNIDSEGATFSAEVLNIGKQQILDFGFILNGDGQESKFSIDQDVLIDFQYQCNVDILPDQTYTVRAFVETATNIVLGNKVSFIGLGSKKPEIIDFSPKSGYDNSEVILYGKYFSALNNSISLNGINCEIISQIVDTIIFKTPAMSYFGLANIKIATGTGESVSSQKFNILGPVIHSVTPIEGKSGTIINIKGEHFIGNGENYSVKFGDNEAIILKSADSSIELLAPALGLLNDQNFIISITNGLKNTSYEQKFVMQKSWKELEPTPFEWGYQYGGFAHGNSVYILELNERVFYEYDPVSDAWNSEGFAVYPGTKTENSQYIVRDDIVYYFGGVDYRNIKRFELWSYDFNNHVWQQKNDLPFSFYLAMSFRLGGYDYIITDDGQVWQCDFKNEQYTRLNDFPTTYQFFSTSFKVDNVVYAVTLGETWKYEEYNDSWSMVSDNPFEVGRYGTPQPIGFMYKNTGYVLTSGSRLYRYDPTRKMWLLTSEYPEFPNSYKVAFVIDGVVYFAVTSSYYGAGAPFLFSYED
jgi:hypothetical protein